MDTLSATDSYASLLFAMPQLQPLTVLAVFFLTLARLLPMFSLVPFLGANKVLPGTIRIMFSLALVAIFLPQNLMQIHQDLRFDFVYAMLMVKELLIGMFLAFLASVPFYVAQMAGSLVDHQRGSSALQVTDPTTQTQTGPIGSLMNYLLMALFFGLGGPFLFFNGVGTSYELIPVNKLVNPSFFQGQTYFWKQIIALLQKMMSLAIQLSAPALIGILLTDLFLGIANRLAPQVQIVFLGISLKSWVGIALMTAAWTLMLQVMSQESITWMKVIQQWLQQVKVT
ncbi:MAG: flagellar biosynthetic protein FliR [Chlamydiia bacterium]|nr:flagellar biosynthetic protein FliR [Chlamydiia bacterium]